MNTRGVYLILFLPLFLNAANIPQRFKRDLKCGRPLPDYDYFDYGYDVTELDIYRCPQISGRRSKIYDLNKCNSKQKWTNSLNRIEFDVPDAIRMIASIGTTTNDGQVFHDLEQYRSQLLSNMDVGDYYKKIMFLKDSEYKRMAEIFGNKSRIVVSSNVGNLYNLRFNEYEAGNSFSNAFRRDLDSLPPEFIGNEVAYIEFIRKYGTHYLFTGVWGGMTRRVSVFGAEHKDVNDFDLISKAKKSFPKLNAGDSQVCRNSDSDKVAVFKNYDINYSQEFHGGYVSDILEEGVEVWLSRVNANPALLTADFRPISAILPQTHEAAMEAAIVGYAARANLDEKIRELKERVNQIGSKKESVVNVFKDYETIVNKNIYDKVTLDKLTNRVLFEKREMLLKEIADQRSNSTGNAVNIHTGKICAIVTIATLFFAHFTINM